MILEIDLHDSVAQMLAGAAAIQGETQTEALHRAVILYNQLVRANVSGQDVLVHQNGQYRKIIFPGGSDGHHFRNH